MTLDRLRRRNRRRRRSGETNSLQARAPIDASRKIAEPSNTPEQEKRIARIDLILGAVVSLLGFAALLTQRLDSLQWAAPFMLGAFSLAMLVGGAFAVWVNRSKIQRAIEESDFL